MVDTLKGRAGDPALSSTQTQTNVTSSLIASTHNDDAARCERCRRPLRAPLAVRAGIGATCALLALGGEAR